MLGVLVLGFAGTWMTGACGSDETTSGSSTPGICPLAGACEPAECAATIEQPCKRFMIQLQGDPSGDIDARRRYKKEFGSSCYMSADSPSTFNCFYQSVEVKTKSGKDGKACKDAQMVAQVYGAAPYAEGYTCQEVPGTNKENYTLQVGPDPTQVVHIDLMEAPLQNPLIEVDAVPTIAVNGPYRNLPEPQDLAPGNDFYKNVVDKNGTTIGQRELILQANRNANGGKIRSDLAGFVYPCDKADPSKMCTEPDFLIEGSPNDADAAQVHHVARRKDTRCCAWGTNSNTNAAVISRKLNIILTNSYPSAAEVVQINQVTPYNP